MLLATEGKERMIHRLDPTPQTSGGMPRHLSPMLAAAGELPTPDDTWAYEFKWDGMRLLVWIEGGSARAMSRNGNDVTRSFPELQRLAEAVGSDRMVLDGELVALGDDGRPSFSRLQHRIHLGSAKDVDRAASRDPVSLLIFDLLHLNGRSLLDRAYDDRRLQLEGLNLAGPHWATIPTFTEESGSDVLRVSTEFGLEGVVAKRRRSTYQVGVRSRDWLKVKNQRTQEVVIGGWTAGQGSRRSLFGSLLVGLPSSSHPRTLIYTGKVGSGFTADGMRELLDRLRPLVRTTHPFGGSLPRDVEPGVTWVRPSAVGEVRFSEWTEGGLLRHPVWRGLRPDKEPGEVALES